MTDELFPEETTDDDGDSIDPRGVIREPTVDMPEGYEYGVTRFADVVISNALPERFVDLLDTLKKFTIDLDELRQGGGGRTVFVSRFDASLEAHDESVWGKRNITIERRIGFDGETHPVSRTRGHEIDMFGQESPDEPFPGIAVEMEWNNKDPFFDRDLLNFQALHREGAIVAGVIVTRGPTLQSLIGPTIRSKDGGFKYGLSSTHWDKLTPRVNLGGGGECPLILIGIEPPRVTNLKLAYDVHTLLADADDFKANWRDRFSSWAEAKPIYDRMRDRARDLLPPLADVDSGD